MSASLILHRLGSYARQNSIHQALAEIGRVHKTIHIPKTLDDEEYRRRMGRELNKGEASHALSRFLCFGKEGHLQGQEFGDHLHTFSCLSVLHNAVVAWNMLHIGRVVEELRANGMCLTRRRSRSPPRCSTNTSIRMDATILMWTACAKRLIHGSGRLMWFFGWMWPIGA